MKKLFLLMMVCIAMAVTFVSCEHATATVYFENHYQYTCAVKVFDGEFTDVTGQAPVLTAWAKSGKSVVEPGFKFPEVCTVVYYIGTEETTEGEETITTMKATYPSVNKDLKGWARVTFSIEANGMYGVSCSNM